MDQRQPIGRNAIIDGWRGISVLMVVIGHLFAYRAPEVYPIGALNSLGLSIGDKSLAIVSSLGTLGVSFFFMISGYLITTLLVAEESQRDRVSLRAFYVRRIFRIMPAFYTYVIVIYLLGQWDLVRVDNGAVLRSALYVCNYAGFSCSWWLAHTWSLAVEEQFYLVWPLIFAFVAAFRISAAVILLAGLFVGSLVFAPLGSFIYIMVGVLVALSAGLRQRFARVASRYIWLALAVLISLPAAPRVVGQIAAHAQPALVAMILFGTLLARDEGWLQKLLRQPFLTRVGLISYSLYLWQQLSLAPAHWGGAATGADTLYKGWDLMLAFAFIPLAIASYFLIEKPMVRIGHRISRRIMQQRREPARARSSA
ncbi:hypothetical protein CDQ92_08215 [Sphingopyxis bauzanensis]|uniref:Acyltransferase 3 domain-containing protein n=1 Tax=Sphingopyxis bauzanensis TaxID=651663 RepID=A0A246JVJ1_9SPHN|nr:acyltransferase [Sphingopyxis bauzanensis]OWQ97058.1 hypothetical protein CDQ92_08215 [Sphingopyxis bauzanensis]GGJ41363.1 hypothetical protein GCM10011393_09430 [Sphingopyxis bauzanensis]